MYRTKSARGLWELQIATAKAAGLRVSPDGRECDSAFWSIKAFGARIKAKVIDYLLLLS